MNNIIEMPGEPIEEVAPGFFETRRRMLWLPLLAVPLALGRAGRVFANQMDKQSSMADKAPNNMDPLDWESFIKQCVPVASKLHEDSSALGQEAYLHWLAWMIVRARTGEIPKAKLNRFGTLDPAVSFGVGYRGTPFFIVEWKLEPGAFLPPHCHPNASVCTVGLSAEARIRNFEVIGQAPEFSSRKSFNVRETHNEIIGAGRINTLSAMRDNIHTFRAGPGGARGIDISTYHGPDVGFSFLELAGKPLDPEGRVFEAAWKGQSV